MGIGALGGGTLVGVGVVAVAATAPGPVGGRTTAGAAEGAAGCGGAMIGVGGCAIDV